MNHLTNVRILAVISVILGLGIMAIVVTQTTRSNSAKLLEVVGNVTVNGSAAIAGAPVNSESSITTALRASAVVSLGKLGRVEVFPSSNLKLTFADPSVSVAMLDQGRVRISSSSGVNASTTTNDGEIATTGNQRNEYIVDTSCGNTFVSVKKGTVELRAGSTVKQIAAGNQDTAGTARPGCTPAP